MASVSYSCECTELTHNIFQMERLTETLRPPPVAIQIELNIFVDLTIVAHDCISSVDNNSDSRITRFTDIKALGFDLDLLKGNQDRVRQLVSSSLPGFGINSSRPNAVENIIGEIIEHGLGLENSRSNMGSKILSLCLLLQGTVLAHDREQERLMREQIAESEAEFEASNYGMVPAKDAKINKMLKKVRLENHGNDNEACMICLEELNVESYGLRTPCSHTFHGDCIKTWLSRSHCCPICRFEKDF